MTKQQVIQAIKTAIAQADTSKALEQLIPFLENNRAYRSMTKVARLVQAKYERAQKDFNQGLVDKEETNQAYNRVNKTILQLVEDLENDDFEWSHYEADMRPNLWQKWMTLALVGIFIVLTGGLGYWIFSDRNPTPLPPDPFPSLTCPEFKTGSDFNVLLLPFQPNVANALTPHITIKRRLNTKSVNDNLNTSIEIDKDYFDNHDTPGQDEAAQAGNECGAQLVIWGIWEKIPEGNLITTDFKYLGFRDHFRFQKLKLESDDQVDTVFALSNIETQGRITQDIEKIIDNYFGLIAGLSGQPQAAVQALEKGVPDSKDTTAFLLNQMSLADNYIAMGKTELAYDVYDNILKAHPNHSLARNNRGVLLYKKGRYAEAADDMTITLNNNPNDADALIVRASANLKQDKLKKAEVDLERVKIVQPSRQRQIEVKTKELEIKKAEKQKNIKDLTSSLETNPNNLKALTDRAANYESLGMHEMAIKDANRARRLNSKSAIVYEVLIEALEEQKDSIGAKTILREARTKGIDLKKTQRQGIIKKSAKN